MTELDTGQVECYSGHTYAQEPRAIIWQGRRYPVAQVERRWRSPEGPAFWVSTETGEQFQLHYHETARRWAIHLQTPGADTTVPSDLTTQSQEGVTERNRTSFEHHNEEGEVLDLA